MSVFVAGLVIVQCMTEKRYSRVTDASRDYFAAEKFLEANYAPGQSLIAPPEFAYRFGFHSGLIDDWRIGYGSGKCPEFSSVERAYEKLVEGTPKRYAGVCRGWN